MGQQLAELVKGNWYAGAELESRVCGGDCSHETFNLEQKREPSKYDQEDKGLLFGCTKTAYKPYDLAVNICLIIAKHHLKKQILIHSDGEMKDWEEGKQLCQHFLGYGSNFELDKEETEEQKPKLKGDLAWVYKCKDFPDTTNKGLSSKYDKVYIAGAETTGVFEIDDKKDPVLYIHYSPYGLIATPSPDPKESFQFGGNFVYSSDSRFPERRPIKIHDRRE